MTERMKTESFAYGKLILAKKGEFIMIPSIEYVMAWLTIRLFQVGSVIYEDAWTSIHSLEEAHLFTPAELRIMRTHAHNLLQAAAH